MVRLRHAPGNAAVLERVRAALRITAWLGKHGFPTVKPAALDQPLSIDGWVATAWHYVTSTTETRPRPQHLAQILRHLHRMDAPLTAPKIQPLGTLRADLAADGHHGPAESVLTAAQQAWLLDRCSSVEAAYAELDPPLGYGLIHGDAHTGNLFADGTRWLLGDWDSIANGPRLQDLVPTMIGHRRFGRPHTFCTSFCLIYGIDPDVEHHPAAHILRAAREIRSLAAYIRSGDRPDIRTELQHRLGSLIDGTPTRWRPI
ncbi:phosphotransferase [Nonomuraea sp. MTCD27]|uniref:phosphotransferase n=1 Tax=Nonomuraea sp. MTCD27 TaxID=1676747 RepID=UPI0035C1BD55